MNTSPAGLEAPRELVPRLYCSPLYHQLLTWAPPQARQKRPLTRCEPRHVLATLGLCLEFLRKSRWCLYGDYRFLQYSLPAFLSWCWKLLSACGLAMMKQRKRLLKEVWWDWGGASAEERGDGAGEKLALGRSRCWVEVWWGWGGVSASYVWHCW